MEKQIDEMLSQNTEGFMWALANVMAERVEAIRSENVLPEWLQREAISHHESLKQAAYEHAKLINPNRA